MRNPGLVAFAVTVGLLAPVVVFQLAAGPKQRDMLFAPAANSLEINGVHVDASLDHRIVDPGGTIHLDLVAPSSVEVGIVVFGSSGTEGARVPEPPVGVLHETVSVEGGKTKHVAIKLRGGHNSYEPVVTYSIFVMSPKAANKLAKLQDRAGPSIPTGEIPDMDTDTQKLFSLLYKIGGDDIENKADAKLFSSTVVARFEAYTRAVGSALTIETPETAQVDRPFTVGVTVKNPSVHSQKIKLGLMFPTIEQGSLALPSDAAKFDSSDEVIELGKGESRRIELQVTATRPGVLALEAHVDCVEGPHCYEHFKTGTFDAVQILPASPAVANR